MNLLLNINVNANTDCEIKKRRKKNGSSSMQQVIRAFKGCDEKNTVDVAYADAMH